jgi:hypothetical protein
MKEQNDKISFFLYRELGIRHGKLQRAPSNDTNTVTCAIKSDPQHSFMNHIIHVCLDLTQDWMSRSIASDARYWVENDVASSRTKLRDRLKMAGTQFSLKVHLP